MVLARKSQGSREKIGMFDNKHACCRFAARAQFVCLCAGGENLTDFAQRVIVGLRL